MKKTNIAKKVILSIVAASMLFISAASVSAASVKLTSTATNNTVLVGETATVSAPASAQNVKWSSTDTNVLAINANGNVATIKGMEEGTATVKAIVDGTLVKQNIVVSGDIELQSIGLSKVNTTLNVEGSETLKVTYNPTNTTVDKTVAWTSSNTNVATVSEGTVKAVAPGTATITAKVGDKSASCTVSVQAPLQKITLNKTSASLKTEQTVQLSVGYTPANTTDAKTVKWTSSNNGLATVNANGKVTAIKAGTVTITAKVGAKAATCTIKITASAGRYVNTSACYAQLNNYRRARKLRTLSKNATLEKHAKTRCKELVKKFSHTRPNGKKGLSLIKGNLYKGENIAKGQTSCAAVSKAWYNSKGHRANMLHKKYKKVGIAGFLYNGTYYWVQLFSS